MWLEVELLLIHDTLCQVHSTSQRSILAGMGSARTGLGLEDKMLWSWPWPRRCTRLWLRGDLAVRRWILLDTMCTDVGYSSLFCLCCTFSCLFSSTTYDLRSLTNHVGFHRRTWPWSEMIWPWPRPRRHLALASTMASSNTSLHSGAVTDGHTSENADNDNVMLQWTVESKKVNSDNF